MSSSYSSPSSPPPGATSSVLSSTVQPVRISAGTAVKIGFFGALGATLFSLVLSLIAGIVLVVLALLGVGVAGLFQNLPR